MIRWFIF